MDRITKEDIHHALAMQDLARDSYVVLVEAVLTKKTDPLDVPMFMFLFGYELAVGFHRGGSCEKMEQVLDHIIRAGASDGDRTINQERYESQLPKPLEGVALFQGLYRAGDHEGDCEPESEKSYKKYQRPGMN